jgi:hypothetical protein
MTGVFMGVLYPVLFTSTTSIFSLATFAVTQRFVIIPCGLVAAGLTFPIVSLAVLQISKYIQDYSHLYRGKRDIRDWLSFKQQNPNIFTEKTNTQRDASSTFDREQTREARCVGRRRSSSGDRGFSFLGNRRIRLTSVLICTDCWE